MPRKQCRTCRFALMLIDLVNVVHCGSEKHALWMDEQAGGSYNVEEFKQQGFLDLYSLEAVAEGTYCCPHWEAKKEG